VKAT
jgi:hypothetical protein